MVLRGEGERRGCGGSAYVQRFTVDEILLLKFRGWSMATNGAQKFNRAHARTLLHETREREQYPSQRGDDESRGAAFFFSNTMMT